MMGVSAVRSRRDPVGRLEQSQAARRSRIIEAVLELAQSDGYEGVQLRAVSGRSGVSIDTIYRYYRTRDALIAAAVRIWVEREFIAPSRDWPQPATPAERFLAVTRQMWALWENNPRMLKVYVRAVELEGRVPDGLRAQALERVRPLLESALRDVEPVLREDLLMIHATATHSLMASVVNDQLAVTDAAPVMEKIVLRLSQHPGMDPHRPPSWSYRIDSEGSPRAQRGLSGPTESGPPVSRP
jgi:TetR/AcrR family transcriptional regulator, cholesterol catabolism regulator